MKKDVLLRKATFVILVMKGAQGTEMEPRHGHESPNPQLYERRMFRIETKVGALDVGDARGNVIRLIEGKVVQPGCNR